MFGIPEAVAQSTPKPEYELMKMPASQLDACGDCLDMHSNDARAAGESAQRLHLLPARRETDVYSMRERATPALTEAVTAIGDDHVPFERRAQSCPRLPA